MASGHLERPGVRSISATQEERSKRARGGDWQKGVWAASRYYFQLIGCSPTRDIWMEFTTETSRESVNTLQHTHPYQANSSAVLLSEWLPLGQAGL